MSPPTEEEQNGNKPTAPTITKDNIVEAAVTAASTVAEVLPTPPTNQLTGDLDKEEVAHTIRQEPTKSHALAVDDHEEKGIAQEGHTYEVVNLGWNKRKEKIPAPLVGGLDNEELFMLVRRFNKQMYHVREVTTEVPGDLDLNVADEEEFSPDKLRANVERLYMTVLIGLLGAFKHVVRLRSWRESKRTACFCTVYFLAWALDLLTPLVASTLIVLIVHPPSREVLFPPAPLALVSDTGGVQKPKAGMLGSLDSATGAPENHKGEAVEQEATNFFNGFTNIVLTSATGKHPQADPDGQDVAAENAIPDPTSIAVEAAEAKDMANGGHMSPQKDKTKAPVENTLWTKMRPLMHGITDCSDNWERFSNALSPTAPFNSTIPRLRLALLIVPLLLASFYVTSYMFMKCTTFGAGFGFFGNPVIIRGYKILNQRFPKWQKLLEVRNTILKGVPTNAQLTLTLLRIGEANHAPLPPPPRSREGPADRPAEVTDRELRATGAQPPLNATQDELTDAIARHDPSVAHETGGADIDAAKPDSQKPGAPHKRGSKVLGFFKSAARGLVHTTVGADKARATVGSHHAKNRLGAVPPPNAKLTSGPVDFKARYKGNKGRIYITTKATVPAVAFSTTVVDVSSDAIVDKSAVPEYDSDEAGDDDDKDRSTVLHPKWSIPVGDIRELKKIGGYGWKFKLVVGWSLGREVNDGLEITDRKGNVFRVMALPLRDELFNRLVAMGGQKWESW